LTTRAAIDQGAVVRAAAKIADDKGWDALTLADVAAKLRIRPPSLYNHIGGMTGLRRELALLAARELGAALVRATVGKSRDDAVRGLADAYRAFVKRHPGIYAATMIAPVRNDVEIKAAGDDVINTCLSVLGGYGFRGGDGIHAVRAMRSAVHGFCALEGAGGFGLPLDVDKSFKWLVDALIVGLASRSKSRS
jgi:AcrR family transcriptional regulator